MPMFGSTRTALAEGLDAHMRSTHLQAFLKMAPNLIAATSTCSSF
jgi:quinol monooxygenase YgiN